MAPEQALTDDKAKRLNASKATSIPRNAQRIVWSGHTEFRHDLVRLEPTIMQKNVSYKKFQPQLEKVIHAHHFHSVDMKGKTNTHCQAVGGHVHEVILEWGQDEQGEPYIKNAVCGPAVRQVMKRTRSGKSRSVYEPVRFAQAAGESPDDEVDNENVEAVAYITDDHTHDLKYVRSEMISPELIRKRQEADKSKIAAMVAAQPGIVAGAQKKETDEDKTDASVTDTTQED